MNLPEFPSLRYNVETPFSIALFLKNSSLSSIVLKNNDCFCQLAVGSRLGHKLIGQHEPRKSMSTVEIGPEAMETIGLALGTSQSDKISGMYRIDRCWRQFSKETSRDILLCGQWLRLTCQEYPMVLALIIPGSSTMPLQRLQNLYLQHDTTPLSTRTKA